MLSYVKNNLIIFVLNMFSCSLCAQNYSSININTSNGLPNNQVEAILIDSRGILWVGTDNGLSKIENGEIENFFTEDGLAHNSNWSIIEDSKTNIWLGSYGGGVTHYDGNKFTVFNKDKGLVNNFVRKLFEYKNLIFIGTDNGLSTINLQTYEVEIINTNIEGFQIMKFFVYKDDIYCATFKSGIFKINLKNKSINKVFDNENEANDALFSLYAKDSILYYGVNEAMNSKSKGALKKFKIENLLNNKKEDFIFGESIIWDYAVDTNNNLYGAGWGVLSTVGGVYQIKEDKLINRSEDFGIASPNVRCLFYDKEYNSLYAGTTDIGFYKIDLDKTILYFKYPNQTIIDIESSDENLLLLTTNGLHILNKDIKYVSNFTFFEKAGHISEGPKHFIKNNPKNIIFYKILVRNSSIWIGSNIGLYQLNKKGEILKHYDITTYNFEFDIKKSFLNPVPYSSLYLYSDLENLISKEFYTKDSNTPVNVTSYAKFSKKIYVSTEKKGLFVYENGQFTSLQQLAKFDQLEIEHLSVINEKRILVIATSMGEVFLADINNDFKIIKKINRDSIIGNSILFLETYEANVLVGTERGLNIFYNDNDRFQFFDEEQGFTNKRFTSSKIVNNNLIIGTNSGYYSVDLNQILNKKISKLKAKLTNIQVNHKNDSLMSKEWFKINESSFAFQHDNNVIDLVYKVSNHPYPNKLFYSYQIEGLDGIWSKYSNVSKIYLQYLPVGTYHVKVKIKDLSTGSISLSKLAIITILPPFWKTWWFILLVVLIALITGFIGYKNRIRYIKKREKQKAKISQRLVETKMEALQSQMNPHFTFNAMNSIQNYIIDNDIDNALMYLSEFAKLIRTTLDNSSKHLILLAEEINYLKSYMVLENMRFNNKVEISINYDRLETNNIEIPPMIIQPFVENAFVHAFNKDHINPKIIIEFYIENQLLICVIEDNGKGLGETSSGQIHHPKGIKLVKERLALLNKNNNNSFKITSEEGKGTKTTLQFKLLELDV